MHQTSRALATLAILAILIGCQTTRTANQSLDIRHFGAAGDGKKLDSPAINRAIESAAKGGGGTVKLSAGTYRCYSIRLRSNVHLHLDQGATILAAEQPATQPTTQPGFDAWEPNVKDPSHDMQDFGHSHFHNSLIWGENLENVSITGPGLIDGAFRLNLDYYRDKGTKGYANKAIALKFCRNVIIRDVSIRAAGHFGILATCCDNLTIDNLKIDTNRDGMNIDCCRFVNISNCIVNSPHDDAICLKSSFGANIVRDTENVTITNCHVSGYSVGSVLDGTFKGGADEVITKNGGPMGRIKMGTESDGGFKNITISNCTFENCHGLALMTVDGGTLEDVTISNITMRHIAESPFFIRLGARQRTPIKDAPLGQIRRVYISNVVVDDNEATCCSTITGQPGHNIEDINFSDIRIVARGGGTPEQAARKLEDLPKNYPEPSMFNPTPAYGFVIRHARGIRMSNVKIDLMKPDARPAFVVDDVQDVSRDGSEVK